MLSAKPPPLGWRSLNASPGRRKTRLRPAPVSAKPELLETCFRYPAQVHRDNQIEALTAAFRLLA
jgi:hypothetical protein